jgi:hypothetical protein
MGIQELASPLKNALLYPILSFIVLFVLFHVYVYVARPSTRFLKQVDYAWLTLAALSIISAADDQRRMLAQGSVQTGANWFINEVSVPVNQVHFLRRLICETPWNVDERGRVEIASECTWYTDLEKSWAGLDAVLRDQNISQTERATKAVRQLEQVSVPSDAPAKSASDVADLRDRITNAKASGSQYLTIVQSLERTEGEQALIFFLPYLIAAAVALRFAKATGEVRLTPT